KGLREGVDSAGAAAAPASEASVGKTTLSEGAAVQRKESSNAPAGSGDAAPPRAPASDAAPSITQLFARPATVQARGAVEARSAEDRDGVHQAAAAGISGSSGAMPFLADVQRGFGHHDVSGIQAHTDGAAGDGARAMGAEAFASGGHVAFAGAPSLFTAAHEAAHVVQQRAGVTVDGGVGQAGDHHERHADQVAERVVAGESAVDLLDQVAGPRAAGASRGPTGGGAVQRRVENRPATHPVLHQGSRGPDVNHLQTRLNQDGAAPPLVVDSWFGPLTAAAVIAFQGRHGLEADGKVGLRTWGALDELDRRGIAGPTRTALDDTRPVSQADHDAVETILNPNVPAGGVSPPMTGTGPGGAYETAMLAGLNTLAARITGGLAAAPAANMAQANSMSDLAQEKVQGVFGSSIALASRTPSGDFQPGSSRMGLADATTRPVDEGTILGWTAYFMDNGSYEPGQAQASHHFDISRAVPDRAEHDRVRDLWLNGGGRAKATAMIRAWPAEAGTGTVFLQLRDTGYQDRVGMWSLFGTLIHEFMHLAAHPTYAAAAEAIGGAARDVLIEGMDEHMTTQAWNAIRPTIAGDRRLRQAVEGSFFREPVNAADYAAGGAIDARILGSHYDSMAQADQIAARVGEPNVRAAYFMGHVEAIGLGPSTRGENSLAGLASWAPGTGGTPDRYPVPAGGETVQQVRDRTGVAQVQDSGGVVQADPAHSFAAGEVLQLVGVRWHTAIAEDTRGQVATQHGIQQAALERANRLPAAAPTTAIAVGTVLLIPVR
ncbi:MAG TPA: peptidoglycan-binding protein, partial [Kofleriaceae bacterium]|nr:peptidoglycan-binding protein [Kofleriaceae bacterium]